MGGKKDKLKIKRADTGRLAVGWEGEKLAGKREKQSGKGRGREHRGAGENKIPLQVLGGPCLLYANLANILDY